MTFEQTEPDRWEFKDTDGVFLGLLVDLGMMEYEFRWASRSVKLSGTFVGVQRDAMCYVRAYYADVANRIGRALK